MRTEFDFGPLFRSTVGFDRMLDALRSASRVEHPENYPPYDIERLGEDEYRVTLAVAGFRPEELAVTAQQNLLVVAGERGRRGEREPSDSPNGGEGGRQLLHRGIAARAFERRFELADHVRVVGAGLSDGLLTVDLRREVPEAMRPRRVEIGAPGAAEGGGGPRPRRQLEGRAEDGREAA